MDKKLSAILIFLFCALSVSARNADPVVTVRGIPPAENIAAGNAAVITVELDIREPYHINSDQPLEEFLIPTSLEMDPVPGITFGDIRYPVAQIKEFPFTDSPMAVFDGTVGIQFELIADSTLAGREVVLKGRINSQACDNSVCLPPATTEFSIPLSVGDGSGDAANTAGAALSVEGTDNGSGGLFLVDFEESSLPILLMLVFLGGLALNLTPCVYPMIPITITYFGGQAEGRKGSLVAHSSLYVIGMAITYSILGVIAALTGGLLGSALRYPPVLIGIALLMVLLALSMFDVYEFRMPSFLNRLAGGTRKGYAGTFLMGLTVGIVAAPCIGPFVFGLLTYVGNRGSVFLGFLLFFVLALGLGLPLLFLGIFSGSMNRLPRSGDWMVWVRKVFGFILLAMAVFFLKTLFTNPLIFPMVMALIMLLAGIYLAWIAPVSTAGRFFIWLRNIVGIVFFSAALIFTVSGLQSYVESVAGSRTGGISSGMDLRGGGGIEWRPFSEQLLEQASQEGKPVLIDFFADWCAPCKELDRHTFTAPEVIDKSANFIMLKVDLTGVGDGETEALRERYRILGVPTLLFLNPDGSEIEDLRVTGFEPPDVFLPKMEEAYRAGRNAMAQDTM